VRILFVCTGNLCRSPFAERLATDWARMMLAGSPEALDVHVESAGLAATPGQEMDLHTAAALRRHGIASEDFRSQALTKEHAQMADLVLTMTREQRRAVLELEPRGLRKTFTLTEAADLLGGADVRGLSLTPLTERARHLGVRLDAARAHRVTTGSEDLADPIGQRESVHGEVAARIETSLRPLADVLFTSVRTELPAPVAL
jgi:low molecular weight protein-tyrosine phosphatase